MASSIDPTKPEDGVPAAKADLRNNLTSAKAEIEHGGFAEGLAPTSYTPASSRTKDHLAAIDTALGGKAGAFLELADAPGSYVAQAARFLRVKPDESGLEFVAAPGGSGGLTGWVDVKSDYGAAGDGVADDTAALQSALSSGASHVYVPAGDYRITATLNLPVGITLFGAGRDRTRIFTTNSVLLLNVDGGAPTQLAGLTADAVRGQRYVTLTSTPSGIGDIGESIVILISTDLWPSNANAYRNYYQTGQYARIAGQNGATLYLADALYDPYVAANTQVGYMPKRPFKLADLMLENTGGGDCLNIHHMNGVVIENCHMYGTGPNSTFTIQRSHNVQVNRCTVTSNDTGSQAYGLIIANAQMVRLFQSVFDSTRHAVTVGGSPGTAYNDAAIVNRDVHMNHCTFGGRHEDTTNATAGGPDHHGNVEFSTIKHSVVYGGTIDIGGRNNEYSYNYIHSSAASSGDPTKAAFLIAEPCGSFRIIGNTMYVPGTIHGFQATGASDLDKISEDPSVIYIANNRIFGPASALPLVNIETDGLVTPRLDIVLLGNELSSRQTLLKVRNKSGTNKVRNIRAKGNFSTEGAVNIDIGTGNITGTLVQDDF